MVFMVVLVIQFSVTVRGHKEDCFCYTNFNNLIVDASWISTVSSLTPALFVLVRADSGLPTFYGFAGLSFVSLRRAFVFSCSVT